MDIKTPLDGALLLHQKNRSVFPLIVGDKIPPLNMEPNTWPIGKSQQDLIAYAEANPDANWALHCGLSGLFAIDIDVKNGKNGWDKIKELEAIHGKLPETFTVETPSGGTHLIFLYKGRLGPTRGKIDPGIDTRSGNSYVVTPFSRLGLNGQSKPYIIKNNTPFAPLPQWFEDITQEAIQKEEFILPSENVKDSIPEGERDSTLTSIAGFLRAKGTTTEELSKILPIYDESRCTIPLGAKGTNKIANSIGKKPTEEAKQLTRELEAYKDFKETSDADEMRKEGNWPKDEADYAIGQAPSRIWLLEDILPMQEISGLYGEGSSGKSLLTMQMAYALATGGKFLDIPVSTKTRVLGIYCEDSDDELWRRLDSIRQAPEYQFGRPKKGMLKLWARNGMDNALVRMDGNDVVPGPFMPQLRAYLKYAGDEHTLLILDTLSDIYMGDENTREKVNKVVKVYIQGIANEYNITPLILAHPSRTGTSTGDLLSGSTAWRNAMRNHLGLVKDGGTRIFKRLKANYAGDDETGIRLRWDAGRYVKVDYNEPTPAMKETRRVFGSFLTRKFRANGEFIIDRNWVLNQVDGDPEVGGYISDISSAKRKHEKVIEVLKPGPIVVGGREFRYEYRDEKRAKHWLVIDVESDILR